MSLLQVEFLNLQDKVGDKEYGELNTDMRVELHFMRQ